MSFSCSFLFKPFGSFNFPTKFGVQLPGLMYVEPDFGRFSLAIETYRNLFNNNGQQVEHNKNSIHTLWLKNIEIP